MTRAKVYANSDRTKFWNATPQWLRIIVHDCLVHPIAGLLWAVNYRLSRFAYALHNETAPMLCVKCERRYDADDCPKCGTVLV